jgi:NAD(P)-dependent dehydrogenase (short-subunit alcohol dehydrogenase family)
MSTAPTVTSIQREPELLGQIVVVIGGSAGIGLETARRARAEGAEVILAGRNPDRLEHAARELGALSSAAFDAADADRLAGFFQALPTPIDHVLVTAGRPYYTSLADMDFEQAHREVDEHLWLALHVALRGGRQGAARRHAAVHERHRCPAPGRRRPDRLGTHRGAARSHRHPGP